MLIESLIKRKNGTKISLGDIVYDFLPDKSGQHVSEVNDTEHIQTLLSIREGYAPVKSATVEKPVMPIPVQTESGIGKQIDLASMDKEALKAYAASIGATVDFRKGLPQIREQLAKYVGQA